MNCATPCAPARLETPGRKLLSCQISRVKKSTGMRASSRGLDHAAERLIDRLVAPCARARDHATHRAPSRRTGAPHLKPAVVIRTLAAIRPTPRMAGIMASGSILPSLTPFAAQ
jgi:hypothetical protein